MNTRKDDDLFAESTMTFGEHLEELRGALFKSVVGLGVAFLIGCFIANYVVEFIQTPVLSALEEYELSHATRILKEKHKGTLPPEIQRMLDAGYVPQETMMIEPFGFLEQLQQDYPDQFQLDFTPHKFIPDDIYPPTSGRVLGDRDPAKELAARLIDDGAASTDSPGKDMWNRLSDSQQAYITKLSESEASSNEDRRTIAAILNTFVDDKELHLQSSFDAIETFSDSVTKDGVAELRERRGRLGDAFSTGDARRLNRLLVAAYLEEFVRPPRVNVVELPTWRPVQKKGLQALRAEEAFMIWIKAALVAGLIISSPWIFYQIWVFVAAGLYPHERNYVYLYLPISLVLFLAGAALAFFFVFKPVLSFLFGFNEWMNIEPDLRIGEWLGFVLFLPIGFGISFQLPLVMLFLNRIGIFTVEMYFDKWRIAVLVIFVLAMFLTPADPVSMLLMAGPLTLLYFGGIAMCRWMPKGRNPFDEAYEPS